MDIIDSLPAIDKEYDHPAVKLYVDSLVEEELKNGKTEENLDIYFQEKGLNLWDSSRLEKSSEILQRSSLVSSGEKLNFQSSTFSMEPPSVNSTIEHLQNQVNAGRIQLNFTESSLLFNEFWLKNLNSVYLNYIKEYEASIKLKEDMIQNLSQECQLLQISRQNIQEKIFPHIISNTSKELNSIKRSFRILEDSLELKRRIYERGLGEELEKYLLENESQQELKRMKKDSVRIEDA